MSLIQYQPIPFVKVSLAIFITIFSWSSAFVGIRIALQGYDPGSLALLRYLIASAGMLFLYLPLRHRSKISLRDGLMIFVTGIFGFGVYNLGLNYGEVTVNSGITSFVISQIPVMVALLALIFLKEKISWQGWLGMLISTIGVGLISWSHHTGAKWDLGIIYVLIATLSAGIYHTCCKSLLQRFNPIELTAYAIWSGTTMLLFWFPPMLREIHTASATATWAVIYLGIVPAVIGYLSWNYVLRYLPAGKSSTFMYALPIVTTILGWLILDEIPMLLSLIGGVIALCGAVIINQRNKKSINDVKNVPKYK